MIEAFFFRTNHMGTQHFVDIHRLCSGLFQASPEATLPVNGESEPPDFVEKWIPCC